MENERILEYTAELQPLYKVPNRKKIPEDTLPEYYVGAVERLKNMAVTTNMWTLDTYKSYITVTGHFIQLDKLQFRIISTKEMVVNHNGVNIAALLRETFDEWDITNKIVAVVSDNGANIKMLSLKYCECMTIHAKHILQI